MKKEKEEEWYYNNNNNNNENHFISDLYLKILYVETAKIHYSP